MLPAWLAVALVLLLLAFVLVRNFQHDHKARAQDTSDLVQKERLAVAATKTAFAYIYGQKRVRAVTAASVELAAAARNPTSVHPIATPPAAPSKPTTPGAPSGPKLRSSLRKVPERSKSSSSTADLFVDRAIEEWRSITALRNARAGAWRRLGITLFLFGKPGGMAAFREIPKLPPPKPLSVAKAGIPSTIRERIAVPEASTLSAAEEAALWETLYGSAGPRPGEVPALRAKLGRLHLGWFEDIAAAQLYDRAGLSVESGRASQQARNSADTVSALLRFELILQLAGILLLAVFTLVWMTRLLVRAIEKPRVPPLPRPQTLHDFEFQPIAAAAPVAAITGPLRALPVSDSALSFRVRTFAFLVYFATFLLISWPLQFLNPLFVHLSDKMALRVSMVVELAVYVPITAITLVALKIFAENERQRRFAWREILAAVGLRTDGFGRDLMTAVVGYTAALPILQLAAIVSEQLFRNFHTPSHPVDLIILNTQDGFTRSLLLVQAAVFAPIVEEIMFRGILFKGLDLRWGKWAAAGLSAAVFALSHNTLPGGFLQLWTLGFVFALVCHRNRSILPNIFMHAIHNGLISIVMFAVFSQ